MKCKHVQYIPLSKRLSSRHLHDVHRDILSTHNFSPNTLVAIPCGKCIYCRESKAMELATRLSFDWTCKELLLKYSIYFVTFTYNDDFCPYTSFNNKTLNREHAELIRDGIYNYMYPFKNGKNGKRIDKDKDDLEYLLCGEYGGRTHRPHYHMICICDLDTDTFLRLISDIWKFGNIDIQDTSTLGCGALSYVASFHSVKTGLFAYSRLKNCVPEHISKWVDKMLNDKEFLLPFCITSRPSLGTFITRCKDKKVVDLRTSILSQDTPYPTFKEPLSNKIMCVPNIQNYTDELFSPKQLYLRTLAVINNVDVDIKDRYFQEHLKGNSSIVDVFHSRNTESIKELIKTQNAILKSKL